LDVVILQSIKANSLYRGLAFSCAATLNSVLILQYAKAYGSVICTMGSEDNSFLHTTLPDRMPFLFSGHFLSGLDHFLS
jgi:hypothetical protein